MNALIGSKKRHGSFGDSPAIVADNTLIRAFEVDVDGTDRFRGEPSCAIGPSTMANDITYILTYEGFLSLSVVIDLFSRRVIGSLSRFARKPLLGWGATQRHADADLPLQALLMAVWRRKRKAKVYMQSCQGPQFTSHEWQEFLEQHYLGPSMSRRSNHWDDAIG